MKINFTKLTAAVLFGFIFVSIKTLDAGTIPVAPSVGDVPGLIKTKSGCDLKATRVPTTSSSVSVDLVCTGTSTAGDNCSMCNFTLTSVPAGQSPAYRRLDCICQK